MNLLTIFIFIEWIAEPLAKNRIKQCELTFSLCNKFKKIASK